MHEEHRSAHNLLIKRLVNDKVRGPMPGLGGMILADTYIGVDWEETLHSLRIGFLATWVLKLACQPASPTHDSYLARRILNSALVPFLWASQKLAMGLDRIWKQQRGTAGYFVVAREP
jgi:hypothetical protein